MWERRRGTLSFFRLSELFDSQTLLRNAEYALLSTAKYRLDANWGRKIWREKKKSEKKKVWAGLNSLYCHSSNSTSATESCHNATRVLNKLKFDHIVVLDEKPGVKSSSPHCSGPKSTKLHRSLYFLCASQPQIFLRQTPTGKKRVIHYMEN